MEDNKNGTAEEMNAGTEEKEADVVGTESTEDTETVETVEEETVAEEKTAENGNDEDEKMSRTDKKKLRKLEAELEALNKELDKKQLEVTTANDKYMRLFAEYDNFRKRTAKEREGIYADAYSDALSQILPVLDNLERAATFSNGEEKDAANLAKGLELTLKSFSETLSKMGVAEIEAQGKTFDPNLHNAVMHVEDENLGENEITEVFMKGYTKGDKVIRHAMVKVAN